MSDWNTPSLSDLYRRIAAGGLPRRLFELMRDEDLGSGPGAGDITSRACVGESRSINAALVARSPGTVAGLAALPDLAEAYGMDVSIRPVSRDGRPAAAGDVLAEISGDERDVLALERSALNLVGRLSGVATRTAMFVRALQQGGAVRARLYDTRKTTPGLRVLEKYAVRCGGGMCHRMGLHDAVLIKDNHIAGVPLKDLAVAVASAAARAKAERPDLLFVETEVDTLDQLREVLSIRAGLIDVVLLDNMDLPVLKEAVLMRDESRVPVELEASGGVGLDTIRAIGETGVERISAGTLTHGAVWLDVALDAAP